MKKETILKLKPTKFALAAAIIISAITFLTTVIATLTPFSSTAIISSIYGTIGYSVSIPGAFIGAIYSFIDTFILAFVFAWLYNKLL